MQQRYDFHLGPSYLRRTRIIEEVLCPRRDLGFAPLRRIGAPETRRDHRKRTTRREKTQAETVLNVRCSQTPSCWVSEPRSSAGPLLWARIRGPTSRRGAPGTANSGLVEDRKTGPIQAIPIKSFPVGRLDYEH
jgi:hypothetical protein